MRRGQREDTLEALLDRAGQGEGVEAFALAPQVHGHAGVDLRAGEHTVQRRAGDILTAVDPRAHPLLAEQLHRRREEVLQEPQLLPVQGVDRSLGARPPAQGG